MLKAAMCEIRGVRHLRDREGAMPNLFADHTVAMVDGLPGVKLAYTKS